MSRLAAIGLGARHIFRRLSDPRQRWRVLYPLPEILLLVLCATLSGMEDFVEIRLWGEQRLDFLRRFLPYERGLPAHDTLNDVINALDADLFKTCFANWVEALRDRAPDIIAIDGKTSRRTHARGKGREPLHLVSAWAARQRLVLGQEAVDDKSNEIIAIPLLLERLELMGALVTIDAMGTQTDIAEKIVGRGGDYLLALKANRPVLHGGRGGVLRRSAGRHAGARAQDHRRRSWPHRGAAPCRLSQDRLAVLGSPLRRRAALPASGHDRHGRNPRRAKRRHRARAALLSSPRQRSTPKPSRRPCAPIGASRTACIGFSMSSSTTISPACAAATGRKTWPWSNTWP